MTQTEVSDAVTLGILHAFSYFVGGTVLYIAAGIAAYAVASGVCKLVGKLRKPRIVESPDLAAAQEKVAAQGEAIAKGRE